MYSYNTFILSEFYNLFNYDTYTFYFIIYLLFYYFIALIFTAQQSTEAAVSNESDDLLNETTIGGVHRLMCSL